MVVPSEAVGQPDTIYLLMRFIIYVRVQYINIHSIPAKQCLTSV